MNLEPQRSNKTSVDRFFGANKLVKTLKAIVVSDMIKGCLLGISYDRIQPVFL